MTKAALLTKATRSGAGESRIESIDFSALIW
nr:MAG TPA: hypothetical protein [Caudoviricetes sp.]